MTAQKSPSTNNEGEERNSSSSMLSLYGELIKSRQTALLVYTTGFAYLLSAWQTGIDWPHATVLIVSLFFAVSGSTLLNMYIDRDIDAVMVRTKNRPIPSGRIPVNNVLVHGIFLVALGIVMSWFLVSQVTGVVVFIGFAFDVVVYSVWLKRKTPVSILFGGIAGGMPALAGRTAAVAQIDLIGILLALFVIAWIPLHILTLALLPDNLEGYRQARVPMWPVVRGEQETMLVITCSGVISAVVILLTGIALSLHLVALLPLLVLSVVIALRAATNLRHPAQSRTFWIFKAASAYMGFAFFWLFIGVVITPVLSTALPSFVQPSGG